jgi:MerR family transcriptional regulator, light-induced transcriptional regulator
VSLAISDVAEQTGIAAGTIRMWEQRYGFPVPDRTPSGYRRYSTDDLEALRRVAALRRRGLSVPAAIQRAQETGAVTGRPSIYAAVADAGHDVRPQILRKTTLIALSRAIEHEALAHAAAPVLFGAFQRERFYRHVARRYQRLSLLADAAFVFADFPEPRIPDDGGPIEVPVGPQDALANEWAVIVDAPGYAACLLGWEHPGAEPAPDGERRFEAIWTVDPRATRRAAQVAVALAAREVPEEGGRVAAMLADRPLAMEEPAPSLTALTNRLVAYLEP